MLANGFFVASEFAIVAVRRSRLEQLAAEGNTSARTAREVITHLDTYIAACQLGITMASLALGWVGEPAFAGIVEPPIAQLAGERAHETAQALAAAISFGFITALHIVVGELAPKGLALQRTEATALAIARPLFVFATIFHWPIAALNGVGNRVLRTVGLEPASGHEQVHSVEELHLLVTGMQRAGVVEASEARIANRAFHFADVSAAELMTPRTDIEGVSRTSSLCELLELAATTRHSRWLVFDGTLDNVVGMLPVRRLFGALNQSAEDFVLDPLIRPVLVVPSTSPVAGVLEEMRKDSQQVAVVLDEFGGTAGMLTLQDIAEALIGSIENEFSPATPSTDGSLVVDGLTRLSELEDLVDLQLDLEALDVDTLGGLLMQRLGRIPVPGDEIEVGGARLRVETVEGHRAGRVRIVPPTLSKS